MVIALLAAIVFLVTSNSTVHGLSCAPPKSAIDEFNKSEYVFKGKVADKRNTKSIEGTLVQFQVQQIWKGPEPVAETIELYESNMWLEFENNTEYLIYASTDLDGKLRGNLCGRSQTWERAKGDVASFGKEGVLVQASEGLGGLSGWVKAILGAVIVLGLAAAWRFGSRRN
ncbi:MAG: Tissue inhibitor of metalloproteinase [Paenibacillus sp.]|nr:Tissue inhibitor of metalloproteinase [Paenibacillus sp.]